MVCLVNRTLEVVTRVDFISSDWTLGGEILMTILHSLLLICKGVGYLSVKVNFQKITGLKQAKLSKRTNQTQVNLLSHCVRSLGYQSTLIKCRSDCMNVGVCEFKINMSFWSETTLLYCIHAGGFSVLSSGLY